jgi:hypothetical protein
MRGFMKSSLVEMGSAPIAAPDHSMHGSGRNRQAPSEKDWSR